MGPGTGQADEEVVATLFGGELGTGFAGDSIAEGGLRWQWSGRMWQVGEWGFYVFANKLAGLLVCPPRNAGFLFSLRAAVSVKRSQLTVILGAVPSLLLWRDIDWCEGRVKIW